MSSTDGLYSAVQRGIIKEMLRLAASDNKANIVRAIALAEKITPDNHKAEMRFVKEKVQQDHPALKIARHVVHDLSPACRDGFINAFVVNALLRGSQKRQAFSQERDMRTPFTVLVSPTMRCNLHCEGCYASEYSHQSDMSGQLFQRIVDEAAEMGVYLITVLGGEPFMRTDLLDVAAANPETYFQVFSNGTLVRPEQVARIAELGNVALMLSIEGDEATTDARRGPGTYRQAPAHDGAAQGARRAVRLLSHRDAQQLGDALERRVRRSPGGPGRRDLLALPLHAGGRGARREPHADPRAAQSRFRLGIQRIRNTKAMFPVDFWGDAPWVEGCIAGKHYVHINNEGWVEPCIFTHFATDNIADTSLAAAFNSPYFREIRARQPFNHNLLMPCMLIDNPDQSREIMAASGARPTHDGAESLITGLCAAVDEYAADVARVYGPVWSEQETTEDHPEMLNEPILAEC